LAHIQDSTQHPEATTQGTIVVNVPYGDNALAADDPAHGYANSQASLYARAIDNKVPVNVAHLSAEHPQATIEVRIPV